MLAPPTFPEWLPPEVEIEANRILNAGADDDLVLRLATDKRMKMVWRTLKKCEPLGHPPASALADAMSDRVDVPSPPAPDALPLFFWLAYTLAWLRPSVGNISVRNLPMALYQLEAARLRLSAANLRKLSLQYGEQVECGSQFANIPPTHRTGGRILR